MVVEEYLEVRVAVLSGEVERRAEGDEAAIGRDRWFEDAEAKGMELLGLVGLGHRLHHRPSELSGGQQQRVAVARALANDPQIILADEPTGNLDLKTGKEIIDLLRDLNTQREVTIISATHDHKMIDVSDRVFHIEDGKLGRVENKRPQ